VFDALALKQDELWEFYTKKGFLVWEDFMGGSIVSTVENWGVSTRLTGGDATIVQVNTFPNRTYQQGVVAVNTNTSASSQAVIRLGSYNNTPGIFFGNGEVVGETYINIETLSDATNRFYDLFGFTGTVNFNTTACYTFLYDEGGTLTNLGAASPNFKVSTFNGTTRSNTTTSVPVVAGQWYKLKVVVNALNTQVDYYIDNILVASHTSGTGLLSLNLKTIRTKTAGTANRVMYVDYFGAKQIFTNQR
jgi:hypothetical protein